uniref:Uncharacterized protein n=1 Tax=Panagrolaimus davidi TaxID=227884 RepID=A0A914PKZ6_9BILA
MAPRNQRQPARQSFATNMKLHYVRTGSKSILFTFSGDDRTRAYKWSKYGNLTQNKEIQKYACTSCDRKILQHRRKLTENIQQMLHPNERADELIKRLYHLGKAAGMTALLE